MRLVDHQHRGMPPGKIAEVGQRRKRAIHREQGIGDDQPAATGSPGKQAVECCHVAMRIDRHLGPRESAAVDDAGVVACVAGDKITGADEGRDRG